ncbi:hypothetical protein [Mesorhizobium abyssinicae]
MTEKTENNTAALYRAYRRGCLGLRLERFGPGAELPGLIDQDN